MGYAIFSTNEEPLVIPTAGVKAALVGLLRYDNFEDQLSDDEIIAMENPKQLPLAELLCERLAEKMSGTYEVRGPDSVEIVSVDTRGFIDEYAGIVASLAAGIPAGTVFELEQDASSDEPADGGTLTYRFDGTPDFPMIWTPAYEHGDGAQFDYRTREPIK